MTLALRYRVIHERNVTLSMGMSFFAWNMGMSFLSHSLYNEALACPVNRGTYATRVWLFYNTVLGAPIYRGLALHYVEEMR
jgi:hypothetical protein